MPTMILSPKESKDILWGNHEDWDVIVDKIVGTSRWRNHYDIIIKKKDGDIFYRSGYAVGATEMQDETPWEYDKEVEWQQVEPKEKTIIEYVPVEE